MLKLFKHIIIIFAMVATCSSLAMASIMAPFKPFENSKIVILYDKKSALEKLVVSQIVQDISKYLKYIEKEHGKRFQGVTERIPREIGKTALVIIRSTSAGAYFAVSVEVQRTGYITRDVIYGVRVFETPAQDFSGSRDEQIAKALSLSNTLSNFVAQVGTLQH